MCGIVGAVWDQAGSPIASPDFDRMTDSLRHRGPDGRGVHRYDGPDGSGVLLGHRRLSIIDLDGGAQPLSNEDQSIWLTFNGEIYNYQELRKSLVQKGHRFRTDGDSETIVHLYEEYGDGFVEYLRGMFAIAIWDQSRRRLVLVRDRLGQKPLVYSQDSGRLLFASEIKALQALPGMPKRVRPQAIDEYLCYGYIPHPGTIYEHVLKLPPGHLAVWEKGRLDVRCYWNPELTPDPGTSQADLQSGLVDAVSEAVRLRMRSDVPLGAFLSGGIDSTVITGVMQQHSSRPVKTFTIGFPVDGFDETPFAQTAADHLGTEHQVLEVRPDSLSLLNKLAWLFDEPFADSSAVPTYYLSQLTRQFVTVALTGDGGDELFAGYNWYRTVNQMQRFDRLPGVLRSVLTGPWRYLIPGGPQASVRQRLRYRLDALREPLPRRYERWMTQYPVTRRQQIYNRDFRQQVDSEKTLAFLESSFAGTEGMPDGQRAMRADRRSYLPCDLLAKVDITSMAHGLECRSPFLDHHVVEAAGRFRFVDLDQPGKVKPMLSETFSEHLPASLQNRSKMGFSVPLDAWFKNDLQAFARETLLASDAFCHAFFEPVAISRMLEEHQAGTWRHGDRIWSLLFLEVWGKINE